MRVFQNAGRQRKQLAGEVAKVLIHGVPLALETPPLLWRQKSSQLCISGTAVLPYWRNEWSSDLCMLVAGARNPRQFELPAIEI